MKELFWVFLRLGTFSFGGPIAAIASMQEEAVKNRKWMTAAEFTEIYGLLKLLPGPLSTQMAIYLGRLRAGRAGGILAGLTYILPAFVMVVILSYYYRKLGKPAHLPIFEGLQIGALAAVVTSTYQLTRSNLKLRESWLLFLASAGFVYCWPQWEALWILGVGLFGISFELGSLGSKVLARTRTTVSILTLKKVLKKARFIIGSLLIGGTIFFLLRNLCGEIFGGLGYLSKETRELWALFFVCFKAGAFVLGSGFAIIPFLQQDVVYRHQWLTQSEFLDGIALGQMTPGPMVITVTFFGYLVAGFWGAIATTVGIFLPPFINILGWFPMVLNLLKKTKVLSIFSLWAVPAVLGGILGSVTRLVPQSIHSTASSLTILVSILMSFFGGVPAWLLIPVTSIVYIIFIYLPF